MTIDRASRNGMRDVNTPLVLLAILYISVIGPAVFIVQPGFVHGLVAGYHFNDQEAGYIASAEMWGIAFTTLAMGFVLHHFNWRVMMALAALVIAAANFLHGTIAPLQQSLPLSLIVRGLAGLGSGVFVSLSFTLIGLTNKPQRNFGLLVIAVLCFGAFGLFVMPSALSLVGMNGVVIFFGLLSLSALPLLRLLPASAEEIVDIDPDAVAVPRIYAALMIAVMAAFFIGQTSVWAYLYLIGLHGGISEQGVANGLSASSFSGIFGAMLATLIGLKFGRIIPTTLAVAGSIVSLVFLLGPFSSLVFAVATGAYCFFWNFMHPLLLSYLSKIDKTGGILAHGIAAQMLGTATGPALAALIVAQNDYSHVLWLGICLYALTLVMVLPLLLHLHRQGGRQGR